MHGALKGGDTHIIVVIHLGVFGHRGRTLHQADRLVIIPTEISADDLDRLLLDRLLQANVLALVG